MVPGARIHMLTIVPGTLCLSSSVCLWHAVHSRCRMRSCASSRPAESLSWAADERGVCAAPRDVAAFLFASLACPPPLPRPEPRPIVRSSRFSKFRTLALQLLAGLAGCASLGNGTHAPCGRKPSASRRLHGLSAVFVCWYISAHVRYSLPYRSYPGRSYAIKTLSRIL